MFAYAHKVFCGFARFIHAESVATDLRKISTLNRLQRGRVVHAEPVTVWLAVRAESVTCPRVIHAESVRMDKLRRWLFAPAPKAFWSFVRFIRAESVTWRMPPYRNTYKLNTNRKESVYPSVRLIAMSLSLSLPATQATACCVCDWPKAAEDAGKMTVLAVNAFTAASTAAATAEMIAALQGSAAQISGNVRGALVGQAMIAEALSSQDTQRLVESDRIATMKAHQFSTTLCQEATGSDITIAQAVAAQTDQVLASRANAHRTGGYRRPESSALPVTAGQVAFAERQARYCDPNDPACRGTVGARPEADRMPGALLAMGRLATADDQAQASWLINNLTMPLPVSALTARDAASAGGQETYIRRGGYEAQLNLAKDLVTETFRTRRMPTADPTYYNQLAAEAGLPQASGPVSQEDMDRMRYVRRFNDRYTTRLAGMGDPTVVLREVVALKAAELQQGQRANALIEGQVLEMGAVLSTLVEGKLGATAGSLR